MTAWWNFSARLILREAYTHFKIPAGDRVTVEFVVGTPPDSEPGLYRFLKWEQEKFGDIRMLNQSENMNEGKTWEYFATLGRAYNTQNPARRPWDYAMKLDDDTFLNIPQLLERLRPIIPRVDTYVVLPRLMGFSDFQGRGTEYWHMGAGYILSWDLVVWLSHHRHEDFLTLPEDQGIGEMLRAGRKGRGNFINLGSQVMDHPSDNEGGDWAREYGQDVILVHRLKNVHLQGDAIEYFLGNPTRSR